MKRFLLPVWAVFALLLSCSFSYPDNPQNDTRSLEEFTGIGIAVHADVYYTPGNKHEIKIEGDARDVSDLITEVKNGFLQVKYDDWRTRRSKLTLYITSSELESVKVSGSAHFMVEDKITCEEMDFALSGSGKIEFNELESDEVEVKISGSGEVLLSSGMADELDAKISGSGDLQAERFEVSEFSGAISGSGSVRITARDELDARISGSGKVHYHGNPRVQSTSSGSGKVVAL